MDKVQESISEQRDEVFNRSHEVELITPCCVGDGIVSLKKEEQDKAIESFRTLAVKKAFFIPASGTGSRMFQFLYEFLNTEEETDKVKFFFENIERFAFYESLPLVVRTKIGSTEKTSIAAYIVSKDGIGYGFKPKGLIPFHEVDGTRYNPFQEQSLQACEILGHDGEIHFTIQEEFHNEINVSISQVLNSENLHCKMNYSVQSTETDAFCFNEKQEAIIEKDSYLRKPAGHGALLDNLNSIDSDFVLIKNIDNIQPMDRCQLSSRYWRIVVGYLAMFKNELKELGDSFSATKLAKLNERYQFLSQSELESINEENFHLILDRPFRVCGMVPNEGKVGGGPFWVKDGDHISKQIVEKSQIAESQLNLLEESTHFNPVFIAISKTDAYGRELDLHDYADMSKYLKVVKSHRGEPVYYRELPGLWNGGMHNWNTIFLELPAEVFTPVKSALDLLQTPHSN